MLVGAAVLILTASGLVRSRPPEEPSPIDSEVLAEEFARISAELQREEARLREIEATPRIIVDVSGCTLRFRTGGEDVLTAPCSAGSGKTLTDTETGATWTFQTPRGEFRILSKLKSPIWRKPDWAFVEEGLRPPAATAAARFEGGVLGDYALGFGDGYFIHGTLYTRLIGENVTHGCIRLEDEPLEVLYKRAPQGTPLLIF